MKREGKDAKYGWLLDCAWGYTLIIGLLFAVLYIMGIVFLVVGTNVEDMILRCVVFTMVISCIVAALSIERFVRKIRMLQTSISNGYDR